MAEEKITMSEARELVSDPVLWPKIRDFLWDFAPQVHPSWLESLKVEGCKVEGSEAPQSNFQPSTMNSPRVKRFILSSLGVEPCFHTFPKEDWSRLALLDGSVLESIAKWLGALVCADALRRVTAGAAVRELKAGLAGVYPEVFGYTEYFRKLKVEKLKVESLKVESLTSESVVLIGMNMLLSMLPENSSLLFRLRLKLPKTLTEQLSTFNFPTSNMRLLLKLRFPEACKVCC